jgi:DNA-binding Lrp family transcriptional regulator
MDELDCRILEALQNDFPLSEKPYEIIANRLQIPCDQLWDRTQRLIAEGVIRRIGASLDSRKLGFCSTLAAVCCKADIVEQAAEIIGRFHEVTHSYLRNDNFNIWFTIIATDKEKIEHILEHIRISLSLESSQVLNLPIKHLFKLNARFNVKP